MPLRLLKKKRAAQEELYAADAALADADIELAAATKALDQVKRSFFDDSLAKQAAARGVEKASPRKLPKAQGPVIFRIAEDPQSGGIRLVQVPWQLFSFNGQPTQAGGQLKFETQAKSPTRAEMPASRKTQHRRRINSRLILTQAT